MNDLGKIRQFIWVEIVQENEGIFMCQQWYVEEILDGFGMNESNVGCPIVSRTILSKQDKGNNVVPTQFNHIVWSLM